MKTVSNIPVFEIEFDQKGKAFKPSQIEELTAHIGGGAVTDLFLFAHGWNNDMADARDLYTRFFTEVGTLLSDGAPAALKQRKFVGAVTLWPSKRFTDKDLIPGGGAAALESQEMAAVRARLKELTREPTRLGKSSPVSAAKQKKIARATALLKTIETNPKAQDDFVRIIRSLLSDRAAHSDDGTSEFFKVKEQTLLQGLRLPVMPSAPVGGGGAASGGAAGLSDIGESVASGLRRLLNMTTYYQMKERAGVVGSTGVAELIRTLRKKAPALRLHLVGHSFGGRVVTAATDTAGPENKVNTLTLLQAAYSHNGLAPKFDGKKDGFFRKVISAKKVSGPIIATCTKNDKAVGVAYPLASRFKGQNAAALGDENDPYGGIGRNGAVRTPEAIKLTLQATQTPYQFTAGNVFNLNADKVIMDHSDICKPEVGWALLSAVASSN